MKAKLKKSVAIIGFGMLGRLAAQLLDKELCDVHVFDLEQDLISPQYFSKTEGPQSLSHEFSKPKGSPGNNHFWGSFLTNCIINPNLWPREFLQQMEVHQKFLKRLGIPFLQLQVQQESPFRLKVFWDGKKHLSKFID
jgi:hypothetical protein